MVRSVFFIKSTQKTQNGQLCLNSYSWNTRQSLLEKKKKKNSPNFYLFIYFFEIKNRTVLKI